MNADELKLITDMISLLSVQGKEAFIWFIALKYGAPLLLNLVLWPCAFIVIIKIVRILNGGDIYETTLRGIRMTLFPEYSGRLTNSEIDLMLKTINYYKKNDSSC